VSLANPFFLHSEITKQTFSKKTYTPYPCFVNFVGQMTVPWTRALKRTLRTIGAVNLMPALCSRNLKRLYPEENTKGVNR
jgi:hypothetical protein